MRFPSPIPVPAGGKERERERKTPVEGLPVVWKHSIPPFETKTCSDSSILLTCLTRFLRVSPSPPSRDITTIFITYRITKGEREISACWLVCRHLTSLFARSAALSLSSPFASSETPHPVSIFPNPQLTMDGHKTPIPFHPHHPHHPSSNYPYYSHAEMNYFHYQANYMRNTRAIGVLWAVFTMCYAIINVVVFVQPQ